MGNWCLLPLGFVWSIFQNYSTRGWETGIVTYPRPSLVWGLPWGQWWGQGVNPQHFRAFLYFWQGHWRKLYGREAELWALEMGNCQTAHAQDLSTTRGETSEQRHSQPHVGTWRRDCWRNIEGIGVGITEEMTWMGFEGWTEFNSARYGKKSRVEFYSIFYWPRTSNENYKPFVPPFPTTIPNPPLLYLLIFHSSYKHTILFTYLLYLLFTVYTTHLH